jgi:xanthine dehydrogenase accessory factor
MLDILKTVNQWLAEGQRVALAIVAETWGSAPRQQGAKMAVTPDLAMIGSVSAGCVEGAVIEEMQAALKSGNGKLLSFGVGDETAWEVGLTCGGNIKVYVEPLNVEWWRAACDLVTQDKRATTITVINGEKSGQKVLYDESGEIVFSTGDMALADMIDTYQKSGLSVLGDYEVMVDVHRPRPHLIIIGGVHIAMPLQGFARQVGFRVSIVDPRRAFATAERFPEVSAILHQYPDKALPELGLDEDTYLAVLTHDPKIDDPALITALPSSAPYIGVLSSSRTHEKRSARLAEKGITAELLSRVNTPIGIDIGAKTPEEIALCILAEIVAVRNGVRT